MKTILVLVIIVLIASCSGKVFKPELLSVEQKFQFQSCFVVYCENSENEKVKRAGLKIIELAAASQNVALDLKRGSCETYYTKRDLSYVYQRKSAEEYCHELRND